MSKARILLADDHTLVVEAFKKLLEPEFEIVATVADGRTLVEVAPSLNPDVVLVDLAMPLLNGLDAGERLKEIIPHARLIVLTISEDSDLASEVLRRWASGYLLKKSSASELRNAIRDVLNGKTYVASAMVPKLVEKSLHGSRPGHARDLTPRQREVLQLLAEGHTMKEVANVLHVTTRTIAFHKYRIMAEFRLKTNSDLILFAIKQRLISSS